MSLDWGQADAELNQTQSALKGLRGCEEGSHDGNREV